MAPTCFPRCRSVSEHVQHFKGAMSKLLLLPENGASTRRCDLINSLIYTTRSLGLQFFPMIYTSRTRPSEMQFVFSIYIGLTFVFVAVVFFNHFFFKITISLQGFITRLWKIHSLFKIKTMDIELNQSENYLNLDPRRKITLKNVHYKYID